MRSHMTLNDVKINHGSLQSGRRRCHGIIDAVPLLAEKMLVNVFLLQF